MKPKIALIDYQMGNLFSIEKRLKRLNCDVVVTADVAEIRKADKLILPGVGHFGKAMEQLKALDLIEVLNEQVVQQNKPILGICLGMQLLGNWSEEGNVKGLGWIEGKVTKFQVKDTINYKVPHTGWNEISTQNDSPLFKKCVEPMEFYFVHSYYFRCEHSENCIATANHEQNFVAAVQKKNIFGVQFHPEKSHEIGNQLLENFILL